MSTPSASASHKKSYKSPLLHDYGTMADLAKEANLGTLADIKGILASCVAGLAAGPNQCQSASW